MAEDSMVDCPVESTPEIQLGSYANAIRIKRTSMGHHVLDFLLYSEVEKRAQVVSRIRISDDFVPQVLDRLHLAYRDFSSVVDLDQAV
jgi:hypothetical protein